MGNTVFEAKLKWLNKSTLLLFSKAFLTTSKQDINTEAVNCGSTHYFCSRILLVILCQENKVFTLLLGFPITV